MIEAKMSLSDWDLFVIVYLRICVLVFCICVFDWARLKWKGEVP